MKLLKTIRKRNQKVAKRLRRKIHIRKRVNGSAEMPRLTMFRSAKHTYAQIIDDVSGRTLVSASTLDKSLRSDIKDLKKAECAKKVGELVAERAIEAGIKTVVFDRNGFLYHGRVKALADGAREKGKTF